MFTQRSATNVTCSSTEGELVPFCLPANNTDVSPGDKVIVTWDSTFFGDTSTLVQIQADFNPLSGDDSTPLDDVGFVSNYLRAGTGSYEWTVSSSILNTTENSNGIGAQLYIVVTTSDGGTENRTLGPVVRVLPTSSSDNTDTGGPNLVVIIVPVVLGFLLLVAIAALFLVKRRNPGWKVKSMFGLGSAAGGYGSRKSRSERVVGTGASGMQMGDVGVSRAPDGRNVFREEIRRQEENRI